MVDPAEKETKVECIELRVTPNAKALLTAAANARHVSVTEFLLTNGIRAAQQELAVPRVFYALEAGWDALQALLDGQEVQPSDTTLQWLSQRHGRR